MITSETAGVKTLICVLEALGELGSISVSELCRRYGLARSSAFAVVKNMELAGLVARQADGSLSLGIEAVRLGYARAGVAALAGPAEAALIWLRDQTGVDVFLFSPKLDQILACTAGPEDADEFGLTYPICDPAGEVVAELRTRHNEFNSPAQQDAFGHKCAQVVLELEHHLQAPEV